LYAIDALHLLGIIPFYFVIFSTYSFEAFFEHFQFGKRANKPSNKLKHQQVNSIIDRELNQYQIHFQ